MLSDFRRGKWGENGRTGIFWDKSLIRVYPLWYQNPQKMRGNVREMEILQVLLPVEVLVQSCAGVWHLSIHPPDGASLCPGQLGASRDVFQILRDWIGLVPCSFWSLLLGLQGAVMLQAWKKLLSLWLCFAHAAFPFSLQEKQAFKKLPQKIHIFTSLQIRLWRNLGWSWMSGCYP